MDSITHLYYPTLAKQGYRFRGNCADEDVDSKRQKYEKMGLEVVIEDRAYDFNTDEIKGMKAILVRER